MEAGDNEETMGRESHTGPGAHSRILALYPKGFLVDFALKNMHMSWECRAI